MVGNNGSFRVDSLTFISDFSDVSIVTISLVVDVLGSSIRESNRVGSGDGSSSVRGLSSVEGSLGVVISDSILKGIGRGSIIDFRGMMSNWGMVSNWSMVGNQRSSMSHNRSSMGNNGSSMDSMSQRGVSNGSMHSMSSMNSMS